MTILGSVDTLTELGVTGWAYGADLREPVSVQAVLDNRILGESVADIHRADLANVGFGDGHCGFSISFYEEIDARYLPFIAVKLAHGEVEFPRTTMSGYGDFFVALYRRFPVCGRSRSVFGGLWTERTDASAVLRGRAETGMINAALEPQLGNFIQNGFVCIDNVDKRGVAGSARRANGAQTRPMNRAIAILADMSIAPFLQAVLEDRPVALRADTLPPSTVHFRQPSAIELLASPAECVALVAPAAGAGVLIDVVRGSHKFPEFTAGGASRYLPGGEALAELMTEHHLVDTLTIEPGGVAIIGPGTIFSISSGPALQVLCVPARQVPAHRLAELRAWQASGSEHHAAGVPASGDG